MPPVTSSLTVVTKRSSQSPTRHTILKLSFVRIATTSGFCSREHSVQQSVILDSGVAAGVHTLDDYATAGGHRRVDAGARHLVYSCYSYSLSAVCVNSRAFFRLT